MCGEFNAKVIRHFHHTQWANALLSERSLRQGHDRRSHLYTNAPTPLTWSFDATVVVGVHTHLVLLQLKRKLARLDRSQLVVRLQLRPAPQATVDEMRQALAVRDLQASVQRSRDDDTARRLMSLLGDSLLQLGKTTIFLQLLDERPDGLFGPLCVLVRHGEVHQALDHWRRERRKQTHLRCHWSGKSARASLR